MNKVLSTTLKIYIFFLLGKIYAQTPLLPPASMPESVVISTPDVMSFQKYGNTPINLYSGKSDIVIPFYEIQAGKIKVPVTLTYNSGGIKVDEIASSAGLGWNLNATGNILVGVKDLRDGVLKYETYGTPVKIPIDIGYNRRYFLKDPIYNSNAELYANLDSSPDFYYVNAPGLNNVFIIDDSNPNDYQTSHTQRKYVSSFLYPKGYKLAELKQENLGSFQGIGFTGEEDGNPSLNIPTKPADVNVVGFVTFKTFTITNEQGLVYTFSVGNMIETRTLPVLVDPTIARLDPSYSMGINTYNLTSIYDPSTQQKVDFFYEKYQITQPQRIKFLSKKNNIGTSDSCNFGFIPEFEGQPIYSNEQLIKYQAATRLQKIVYNGGEVTFSYLLDREDYNDQSLDLITINDNLGNTIKNYRLRYSYFDSKEGCTEKECKRLRLDQIDEWFPKAKLYYKFEYNYTNKLPKRFSYEQDFLGYYNNNGYQNTAYIGAKESGPQPKLYFYPNKGEFSILPFEKKNDTQGRQITGDYSFVPNDYSLTGLLKKVTYETGGFTELNYENHTFNFDGAEYIAGGARVESQVINDGNGNVRNIKYKYQEIDGKSSGYISGLPIFAYPNSKITNPNSPPGQWTPFSFTTYDFDKSGLELTHDTFVGYSRVEEIETGNGKTETLFYSPKDYPDNKSVKQYRDDCGRYLTENSAFPGKLFEDLKSRRGTLKLKRILDESGNKISESENVYEYKIFSSIDIKNHSPYRISDNKYNPRIRVPNYYVSETSKINRERNLQTKVITTEYFKNNPVLNTSTNYVYDPNLDLLKEMTVVNSDGSEIKTRYRYPLDYDLAPLSLVSSNDKLIDIAALVTNNIVNTPIEINNSIVKGGEEYMTDGQLNYFENLKPEKFFKLESSALINVNDFNFSTVMYPPGFVADSRYKEKTSFTKYDNKGNILEIKPADGIVTSYIWGYNSQYPIAKVVNATYQEITNVLGASTLTRLNDGVKYMPIPPNPQIQKIPLTDAEVRSMLSVLRTNLTNAQITTYTYKPLIGMTSETDINDKTTYYEYSDLNKLKIVKDNEGNILSENEYNYKK
ncbi:hypothetical protein [Flavobacterium sp. Root186]|uniref:hypothetical protein n=1 Tax=Flavobacterium sp. Root186 TaxID=1736485 RepID=UPI0006F75B06|nr:hypothetical protein [Flavobacterium sp. Root186]KRB56452.1 hypothetical protein ASD98_11380 [Flavobacterium sp. Root186]